MNLKRILGAVAFSLLTSCVSIKGEEIDKPFVHDMYITLKQSSDRLNIGHDTDGDGYTDIVDVYQSVGVSQLQDYVTLELNRVYEDKNKNHKIEEGELIWKIGDKITKEIFKKKILVFSKAEVGLEFGYDTDGDGFEDTKADYKIVSIDSKTGVIILQKIASYTDRNKNRHFDDDELEEEIEEDYVEPPNVI